MCCVQVVCIPTFLNGWYADINLVCTCPCHLNHAQVYLPNPVLSFPLPWDVICKEKPSLIIIAVPPIRFHGVSDIYMFLLLLTIDSDLGLNNRILLLNFLLSGSWHSSIKSSEYIAMLALLSLNA